MKMCVLFCCLGMTDSVTPRVTLFPNYLLYKLNQASSVMVNQVIKVQDLIFSPSLAILFYFLKPKSELAFPEF
jgi:hypothetical protein